ncbi:Uncharacterised protein [Chromobacterium vaccinii]|nr:Uncharacterised protein [Chromobacterium vaccinii]
MPPLPINLAKSCPQLEPVMVDSWDAVAKGYIDVLFIYASCRSVTVR